MVAAADIKDISSLEAWLLGQPHEVAVAFGARAALRVLPIWAEFCELKAAHDRGLTPLPVLRSCLFSSVVALSPTDEIKTAGSAVQAAAVPGDRAEAAVRAASISSHWSGVGVPRANVLDAAQAAATATVAANANPLTTTPAADSAAIHASMAASCADSAIGSGSASRAFWGTFRRDAETIEAHGDPISRPLWPEANPLQDAWDSTRASWPPDTPYDFWRRWYDSLLAGKPMNPDLLYKIALIRKETWDAGPEAVAAAIREIEAEFGGESSTSGDAIATAIARAYLFDFVEHDRKLRITGVDLDFEGLSPEAIEKCLAALHDWTEDLRDWHDFVGDELAGSNRPCKLRRAVEKIIALVERVNGPEDFPAGRLVSMGGNLRLLALDEAERTTVGDTLAKMMDTRLDDLSGLLGRCFGHVLARLEPLNALDLGDHDPAALIEDIRQALDRIKAADPSELAQLDEDAQATLAEMIRELEELDAAIAAAGDSKLAHTLRARFAARYGGFAATVGRAIEKGQEVSGKVAAKFDNAVKWYKRWETLERIVEWFKDLGGPPPGMG